MTLTINLPDAARGLLEADAQAQGRPIADVLADRVTALYTAPDKKPEPPFPALKAVEDSVGISDTPDAWEKMLDSLALLRLPVPDDPRHAKTNAALKTMRRNGDRIGVARQNFVEFRGVRHPTEERQWPGSNACRCRQRARPAGSPVPAPARRRRRLQVLAFPVPNGRCCI
ncbi:MAG: hypothetical protein M3021_06840 [Actinomycetota bacterium]|nr:hypothetical protein [Actinomycetota bacterium]